MRGAVKVIGLDTAKHVFRGTALPIRARRKAERKGGSTP